MKELTKQELQFLIDISEEKRNSGKRDIITDNITTHNVSVYFVIQKLENQLKQLQ